MVPTLHFTERHRLSMDSVAAIAKRIGDKLTAEMGVQWTLSDNVVTFSVPEGSARGLSGEIEIRPRRVDVWLHLPWAMQLIPQTVELRARKYVRQALEREI